jgi:hypothetical protein
MVGLWLDEYAPIPLRITAFRVAKLTLWLGCSLINFARLSDKVFTIDSESCIEAADFFDAALPLGFFFDP